LNIGMAARASGVSAKLIRYYEHIGLIAPADRTGGNYRIYDERDVHTLRFIKRARSLGFSLERIQVLLGLWQDRARASAEVKRVAMEHVGELDAKIREMESMRDALRHLAHACHGDHRPECPILEELAQEQPTAGGPTADYPTAG
jgi:MerR family transcriptional regulator, copper efflux regulator